MKYKLTLSYDSEAANDGTGAQLQRIFGIYGISKLTRMQYLHSGIRNLTVTPLDPFQSDSELSSYLEDINRVFALPSSRNTPLVFDGVYKIDELTCWKLARFAIQAFFGRKSILLQIKNPYRIIEKFPKAYRHVQHSFNFEQARNYHSRRIKTIVLHIRRGSNGSDILPGEVSPRMLPNSYYFTLVKEILENECKFGDSVELVIITDVPRENFVYRPIASQVELWSTEPRFRNGSITLQGEYFSDFNFDGLAKFSVIHGGDPLNALERMRTADFLVMSRSSFSYVGAILNKHGKVFYPPSFWHKSMPEWVKVK